MDFLSEYLELLELELPTDAKRGFETLYHPIDYLLGIPGKRIRPALVYLGHHCFKADYAVASAAAKSIEWFHNFTLIHDDIMDEASLRRGEQAVHKRWNTTQAILSGDAMLIQAYSFLSVYREGIYAKLVPLFTQTALEVCKGQQWDIDFESAVTVPLQKYLEMVRLKTAVSLGAALKIGAIIAGAPAAQQAVLYSFGVALGIAFQLQDDYLDLFGMPGQVGKKLGGDVIENKKTCLYLIALQRADPYQQKLLTDWYGKKSTDDATKIAAVKRLFEQLDVPRIAQLEVNRYTTRALDELAQLEAAHEQAKGRLQSLAHVLLNRNY